MPAGKGKPAGGYHAGKKGSYGCDGYPTVSADGTVHGCHPTKARAAAQARAIWASTARKSIASVEKAMVAEGDFVVFLCEEDELRVGQVEYVMTEGIYGLSGSEYAMEATPDDPVLSIRLFEEEDGAWEAEQYTVGHKASEVVKVESIKVAQDVIIEMTSTTNGMSATIIDEMDKAVNPCWDGYVQRGMKEQDGKMVPNCVPVEKREFSTASRERMAESGTAMPDGSFPIASRSDLMNAIRSVGRAKDYGKAKAHIISRARALNAMDMLPEDWRNNATKGMGNWSGSIFDLNPFVK